MPENVNPNPEHMKADRQDSEAKKPEVPLTRRLDETLIFTQSAPSPTDEEIPMGVGVLRLELMDTKQTITVPIKEILLMGRPDPVTGKTPDIDFTRLAGYRMGVSRRHAEIHWYHDNILKIYDLGSSNGTFINGERLQKDQAYPLYNGDELRLGQLALYIYYEIMVEHTPVTKENSEQSITHTPGMSHHQNARTEDDPGS